MYLNYTFAELFAINLQTRIINWIDLPGLSNQSETELNYRHKQAEYENVSQ
jgi:hypothetical protein